MDGAQTILLNVTSMARFEVGARLDALLCYSARPPDRQQKIADAICSELMAYTIELDPTQRVELRKRFPQYRKRTSRTSLDTLCDRREEALLAGSAILPLLKKAAIGQLPILSGESRELSIAKIVRYLWPPREEGDEVNYEDRLHAKAKLLRRMRPIAHLAAAYQYVAHELSGAEQAASFDYEDIDFHREVVARANYYADCFNSDPALANIANRLIRIEWRE